MSTLNHAHHVNSSKNSSSQYPSVYHYVVTESSYTTPQEHHSNSCEASPSMMSIPTIDYHDDMEPTIVLNNNNMAISYLPNREKLLTLHDSGANDYLVCATVVQQSNYLTKLPKIKVLAHQITKD